MLRTIRNVRRFVQAAYLLSRNPDEVLVTSTPSEQDRYARILSGSADVHPLSIAPVTVVKSDPGTLSELVKAWSGQTKSATLAKDLNLDDLLSIEISYPKTGSAHSDGAPWNLELVGQPSGAQRSDGDGASVAVLDTGVDYTHPEITPRFGIEKGYNAIGSGEPLDRHGHGTHVAGTVAAETVGMAPGAQLYAVKVLDDYGRGSDGSVVRGIDWSASRKVDVVNMSLGGPGRSEAFQMVINAAHEQGVTLVAAAGNDGREMPSYPAAYDHVISVAAVDRRKRRAYFSNTHRTLDLSGPGVDVRSLTPGGGYRDLSGTSMASPHVAGACAMLKAYGAKDPEAALKRTAEELGERIEYGAGLIRIDRALGAESGMLGRTISYARRIGRMLI